MNEVNVPAEDAAAVIRSLNAHIKSLESQLETMRQQRQGDIARGTASALQYMRAHGFILLYTGPGKAQDAKPRFSEYASGAGGGRSGMESGRCAPATANHCRGTERGRWREQPVVLTYLVCQVLSAHLDACRTAWMPRSCS